MSVLPENKELSPALANSLTLAEAAGELTEAVPEKLQAVLPGQVALPEFMQDPDAKDTVISDPSEGQTDLITEPKRPVGHLHPVTQPAVETPRKSPSKIERELQDLQLVLKSRGGSTLAMDQLIRRYTSFVRLKASSYFLAGGDSQDLIQEGLIGLYKAVRDFKPEKETSFRSFAELCITRQIITAIKTASRHKHHPLNTYISFSHTPRGNSEDVTLGDALPGPSVNDPSVKVISTEELQALVGCLSTTLSSLEADALRLYLEGYSYEQMVEELGVQDPKVIDNALQRVKTKIKRHQKDREVLN